MDYNKDGTVNQKYSGTFKMGRRLVNKLGKEISLRFNADAPQHWKNLDNNYWKTKMTEEEYRTQIKLLEVENRSLRDRIIELERAIKQFGEAIERGLGTNSC